MREIFIEKVIVRPEKHQLKKPYILSFGTISELDSIKTEIRFSNGMATCAESVPLPGYSDETRESILAYLESIIQQIINKPVEEARSLVKNDLEKNPFACSPLLTAIDLRDHPLETPDTKSIDFVVPASSADLPGLEAILKASPKTVKIKLSGHIGTDLDCVGCLETVSPENTFIRFDANKAFSYDDARKFYTRLASSTQLPQVHYVEQPLGNDRWEEHGKLVEEFPEVKTMLDESIVTTNDLQKAISLRVPFVKFKLFKQGGIRELLEQIDLAIANGLKVVLGNGVATKMSNDIENAIYLQYAGKLFGASEANGFLKVK